MEIDRWNNNTQNSHAMLANHMTAFNNQRISRAAGKAHAAAGDTANRIMSDRSRAGFEGSIARAEQLGAIAAATGSSTVEGSGMDAVARAARLQQDRAQAASDRQGRQVAYDLSQQVAASAADIMAAMSLDVAMPNQNIRAMVPEVTGGPDLTPLLSIGGSFLQSRSSPAPTAANANLQPGGWGLTAGGGSTGLNPSLTATRGFFNNPTTNFWRN